MPYPNLPPLVYPQEHTLSDGSTSIHYGLTKRERFAMAAMQGICTFFVESSEDCARYSVRMADALIAELDKREAENE